MNEPPFHPREVFYLQSLRCNERCSKCGHWRVKEHQEMVAVELVLEALLALDHAESFCVVGGEPLVYTERVLKLLRSLAGRSIRTTVITNGVLATPEFLEELRDLDVHLVFSIDTIDPEAWMWVRGTESIDRVMTNIAHAQAVLRPEQISVQSVLAEETRSHVAAVGEWCGKRGITQVIQPYLAEGFEGGWTPIAEHQTDDDVSDTPCRAAGRNISIMPDGSIYTCFQQNLIPGCSTPLGKLGQVPVVEMLSSSYTQTVLDRMRSCSLPCKVLTCNR